MGRRHRAVPGLRRPDPLSGRRGRRPARAHRAPRRALHSFIAVYADDARLAAEGADRAIRSGHRMGPLHGVPIALKDLVELEGRVTTGGSKVWASTRLAGHRHPGRARDRGGHDRARQDPHRRVRDGELGHQHPHGHSAEPVGSGGAPHAGRLLQRLRGRGRGRPRPYRHRHRHRRLGAAARGLVRDRRPEGDRGAHQHLRRPAALLHARHAGADRALGGGRRDPLPPAQRPRPARSSDALVGPGRSAAHPPARCGRPADRA